MKIFLNKLNVHNECVSTYGVKDVTSYLKKYKFFLQYIKTYKKMIEFFF